MPEPQTPEPETNDGKDCAAERRRAVEQFEERRAGWKPVDISIEEILKWRHEGHRY